MPANAGCVRLLRESEEVMGKIIERVRARQRLAALNALGREAAEYEAEKQSRNKKIMEVREKRYQEMLADPRYENVCMHPGTGGIFYTERPERRPWWRFWK